MPSIYGDTVAVADPSGTGDERIGSVLSSISESAGDDDRGAVQLGSDGSLSWIRTNDQVINSHLLYR